MLSEHLAGDNEAVVKGADARLGETEQALLFDPTSGYLNLQGQDALTQAPAVIDAYREAQAREMTTMVDDDQRQMLQDLNERRLASFSTQVERHSAAERIRWYGEAGERRITQMQADARLHWSDDAMLRRALGTTRAEVNEQAERHHWDSALTEATLRRQTSRTLVAAIEMAVERDLERVRSLHTRYEQHIEASDRVRLDALLAEAQTREHARQASAEILNATPPDAEPSTAQWRLRQADAIADPAVRTATIRTLHSVAVADEARAQTLAEQVLARVLKDGLTDPAQIPIREWVALDADHRQAIETRLDLNAAGTEPAPNPALIDELATEMTEAPTTFARRDLVPAVAQLPLPQWQRFRDWQAGLRRNDPAVEDQLHAIKRGLQLANKMLPAKPPDAANHRAGLVDEIDTWRRINGRSPDDDVIAAMVERQIPGVRAQNVVFPFDPGTRSGLRPGVHRIQDATTYGPNPATGRALEAAARAAEVLLRMEAARSLDEALRSLPGRTDLDPETVVRALGMSRVTTYPGRINPNGQAVYYDPQTNRYVVRNTRGGTGYWVEFDAQGRVVGTANEGLIPVERHAQPPADELEKIWQNPPLVPPQMLPPILPGRPIDQNQGKPEIIPAPPPVIPPGPITETLPQIDAKPEIMTSDNEAAKPSTTRNLPRCEECTRAAHECLSAPNMTPELRRECHRIEDECNATVAGVREKQGNAPNVSGGVKFPDGTKVIVGPKGTRIKVIAPNGKELRPPDRPTE
ncbi:MAG: hypothetical protein KF889_28245 [Alphaproteobacteria bacterium]|nr:hypothetical protein [Alphaproteobacteria bacterium]MCW5743847.1 hypothetical protein [Alphaproteobacteria bacterium]